jgi:hypothetical protein
MQERVSMNLYEEIAEMGLSVAQFIRLSKPRLSHTTLKRVNDGLHVHPVTRVRLRRALESVREKVQNRAS